MVVKIHNCTGAPGLFGSSISHCDLPVIENPTPISLHEFSNDLRMASVAAARRLPSSFKNPPSLRLAPNAPKPPPMAPLSPWAAALLAGVAAYELYRSWNDAHVPIIDTPPHTTPIDQWIAEVRELGDLMQRMAELQVMMRVYEMFGFTSLVQQLRDELEGLQIQMATAANTYPVMGNRLEIRAQAGDDNTEPPPANDTSETARNPDQGAVQHLAQVVDQFPFEHIIIPLDYLRDALFAVSSLEDHPKAAQQAVNKLDQLWQNLGPTTGHPNDVASNSFGNPEAEEALKLAIIAALVAAGTDNAAQTLIEILKSNEPDYSQVVISRLHEFPNPESFIATLVDAVTTDDRAYPNDHSDRTLGGKITTVLGGIITATHPETKDLARQYQVARDVMNAIAEMRDALAQGLSRPQPPAQPVPELTAQELAEAEKKAVFLLLSQNNLWDYGGNLLPSSARAAEEFQTLAQKGRPIAQYAREMAEDTDRPAPHRSFAAWIYMFLEGPAVIPVLTQLLEDPRAIIIHRDIVRIIGLGGPDNIAAAPTLARLLSDSQSYTSRPQRYAKIEFISTIWRTLFQIYPNATDTVVDIFRQAVARSNPDVTHIIISALRNAVSTNIGIGPFIAVMFGVIETSSSQNACFEASNAITDWLRSRIEIRFRRAEPEPKNVIPLEDVVGNAFGRTGVAALTHPIPPTPPPPLPSVPDQALAGTPLVSPIVSLAVLLKISESDVPRYLDGLATQNVAISTEVFGKCDDGEFHKQLKTVLRAAVRAGVPNASQAMRWVSNYSPPELD